MKEEDRMKLEPPTTSVFWLSIIIAGIASIMYLLHSFVIPHIKYIAGIAFLLVVIAFAMFLMDVLRED